MTSILRQRLCAAAALVASAGCGGFGRVEQGQVVEYERSSGLITLIQDSNYRDPAHPRFDVLPPVTLRTPADATEMGPEPEAGGLLAIDLRERQAIIYDAETRSLRRVPFGLVSEASVDPDDARVKGVTFPLVDREHRTLSLYSPRTRRLLVMSMADPYLALPPETWKTGDEIRYYYKEPGRALRLMNVSKTSLGRAGK